MTLMRKMILGVLSLLVIIFIGTYLITLHNERNYFIEQMNSNAQDSATSLGLSLSQAWANQDKALMTTMVEAVFDRGNFSSVEVRGVRGELLVSRYDSRGRDVAPRWFARLIGWSAAPQSSVVMNGWNQIGEIFVTSDSEYALTALWHNALSLVFSYALFAFASLVLVYLFIHSMLKPLKRVTEQANAICAGEFPIEKIIPKAPELRQVTLAMNQMSSRIKRMFQEQLQQMEDLRYQAFQDSLTEFGNRRYFLQQLSSLLNNEEEFCPGFLILIAIDGLDLINKTKGFQRGDQIIKDVARACVKFWPSSSLLSEARISGTNFALLINENELDIFLGDCNEFNTKMQKLADNVLCKVSIAAVSYHLHQSVSEILTEADNVLNQARSKANRLAYAHNLHNLKAIAIDSDMITKALSELRLVLFAQTVRGSCESFHQEIYVRIEEQNQLINAGYFMPVAEKAGIAYLIDQFVLSKVLANELLKHNKIALNLTEETVRNEAYRTIYLDKLEGLSMEARANLHIELNEIIVLNHFSKVMLFVKALKKLDIKVGIDQVGLHFSPLHYVNELAIHYLKLHGSLIHDITENQNKQFFIHYFYEMAKTLDIEVIATQIETENQWLTLQNLRLKWGQGKYLSAIEAVAEKTSPV